jgi:hypothetical protein
MGVVIESAALAARLSDTLDSGLPRDAYEPGVGLLQRLWINFLSILPIEWLL